MLTYDAHVQVIADSHTMASTMVTLL